MGRHLILLFCGQKGCVVGRVEDLGGSEMTLR